MRDFFQDPASFLQRVLLSLSVHVDIPPGSIPALAAVAVGLLVPLLLFWLRNRSTHKSGGAGEDDGKSDISRALRKEMRVTSTPSLADLVDRVLNPAVFQDFYVLQVSRVSYNTKLIRLEIPFGKPLGVPIGRHISVAADIDGQKVVRAYTPTSRLDQCGYFELMVKGYEYGKMSSYLNSLKVGAAVAVRGPVGRFKYLVNQYQRIGLVCAGSGLTPCLQVMRCLLEGPGFKQDTTSFTLLYQNRTEEDILLRGVIDKLVQEHPLRLTVIYFLSNPHDPTYGASCPDFPQIQRGGVEGGAGTCLRKQPYEARGYISQAAVEALLPHHTHKGPTEGGDGDNNNNNNKVFACICGPSGFNSTIRQLLVNSGHVEEGGEGPPSIYEW